MFRVELCVLNPESLKSRWLNTDLVLVFRVVLIYVDLSCRIVSSHYRINRIPEDIIITFISLITILTADCSPSVLDAWMLETRFCQMTLLNWTLLNRSVTVSASVAFLSSVSCHKCDLSLPFSLWHVNLLKWLYRNVAAFLEINLIDLCYCWDLNQLFLRPICTEIDI